MTRGVKLALLGASLLALGACAAPDRQPDLDNIAANVEQTQEGDFSEFLCAPALPISNPCTCPRTPGAGQTGRRYRLRCPRQRDGLVERWPSQYPIATVLFTGYADTQGSLEANRALAQRRAQAVAQALRGLGGPLAGSVAVVAMGEPEGAAGSEANSENRRVEVLVAPHGTYNKGP